MNTATVDRVYTTTYDYLYKIRETLGHTSRMVDMAAAMSMGGGDGHETIIATQKAYEHLSEAMGHFVRALKFFTQSSDAPEEKIESWGKARASASFVIGEVEAAINQADTAGAWMLAKGAYSVCELAKKAQTVAWEAEQATRE